MAEITYSSIRPLIESAIQDGNLMRCTFKCPVTGILVKSRAGIHHGHGPAEGAQAAAEKGVLMRVRRAVVQSLQEVLGHGRGGRVDAPELIHATPAQASGPYAEADLQAAQVQAFRNVASRFLWDGPRRRWVSTTAVTEPLTDFARQLSAAPVMQHHDRSILMRMLIDVARADGHIADEERAFFSEFIAGDLGSLEELEQGPPLSLADLASTTPGTRETILMLAWALALADRELADAERDQLTTHAQTLQIADARAAELKRFAQRFIVDQALEPAYPGGKLDPAAHAEVMALAGDIGLPRDEAERVDLRHRKRLGLV